MKTIEVEFELKAPVKVKLLKLDAFINGYYIAIDGVIQYQIEWLDKKDMVNTKYYHADELELREV